MTRFARKMIAIEPRRRDRGERPFAVYVLRVNRPPGRPRGPASVLQRRSKVTTLTPETLAELERLLAELGADRDAAVKRAKSAEARAASAERDKVLAMSTARIACERFAGVKADYNALIDRSVDNARLTAERDILAARLAEAEGRVHTLIADSCNVHDHVQALCRAAGIPESDITGDGYAVPVEDLVDRLLARERDESRRLRLACSRINDEVCQSAGKALGYPWFKDDPANFPGATEANGVCVGDHVAESIVEELARSLARERERADASFRAGAEAMRDEAASWLDDIELPKQAEFLRTWSPKIPTPADDRPTKEMT